MYICGRTLLAGVSLGRKKYIVVMFFRARLLREELLKAGRGARRGAVVVFSELLSLFIYVFWGEVEGSRSQGRIICMYQSL